MILNAIASQSSRQETPEEVILEKHSDLESINEKLLDDSSKIEFQLDMKFGIEPWKKALFFSFLFYLMILFILIIIVILIKKEFNSKLVSIISGIYLLALILSFRYMYKIFKKKFPKFKSNPP